MPKETKGWGEARRRQQAENCRKTRPEQYATGPKTTQGKAASSQNALKSGLHCAEIKALKAALMAQKLYLKNLPSPSIREAQAGGENEDSP